MLRISLLSVAVLAFPITLAAQTHPLAGDWTVSLPGGMRVENGEPTPIMQKGTLKVVAEGDSLIATLSTEPIEGRPARPPSRLAAKRVDGKVTFVLRSEARLNLNGEESVRTAISTFVLDANGDVLSGSLEREVEGLSMPSMGAQPISGTRIKSD
jgi:hypothetical protein